MIIPEGMTLHRGIQALRPGTEIPDEEAAASFGLDVQAINAAAAKKKAAAASAAEATPAPAAPAPAVSGKGAQK
jgi:hypothetical protein